MKNPRNTEVADDYLALPAEKRFLMEKKGTVANHKMPPFTHGHNQQMVPVKAND